MIINIINTVSTIEKKLRSQIVTSSTDHFLIGANTNLKSHFATSISSHDRFLIIDQKELYHLGASLKDLGKKWFAFSRMEGLTQDILSKLSKEGKV